MAFPTRPEQIEVDWLDRRLREAGLLDDGKLIGIEWTPIGTGQVGDSIRFTLSYDREDAGPPSIAGKFAASDPTSKGTAVMMKLYLHEVGFFREFAAELPIRTPKPIFADIAPDNADFILLMEDLGPARQGNQLDSCTVDDARQAIRQAAALHGPTWDAEKFTEAGFVAPDPQIRAIAASLYPAATATFVERYCNDLSETQLAIVRRLGQLANELFSRKNPHNCLVHGDFRLDNMLFDIRGGAEPLAVVDWQTLGPGDGAVDIGYFMGAGIGSDLRREHENELLELYCAEMAKHGVDLSRAEIDEGYRFGAIRGATTAVFSAANVVRTERGDANFLSMVRGAIDLIEDTNALELLEG